jgi:hypothetical protein
MIKISLNKKTFLSDINLIRENFFVIKIINNSRKFFNSKFMIKISLNQKTFLSDINLIFLNLVNKKL